MLRTTNLKKWIFSNAMLKLDGHHFVMASSFLLSDITWHWTRSLVTSARVHHDSNLKFNYVFLNIAYWKGPRSRKSYYQISYSVGYDLRNILTGSQMQDFFQIIFLKILLEVVFFLSFLVAFLLNVFFYLLFLNWAFTHDSKKS